MLQPLVWHIEFLPKLTLFLSSVPVPNINGGGLKSRSEALAVLSVGEAARSVIKSELCQALSQARLQGVLFWRLRLPLLQLLVVDPPQCCSPCLNVLHVPLVTVRDN